MRAFISILLLILVLSCKPKNYSEFSKTNVDLFPSSWNSYDSYGEILLKMGKKDEAIQMYRKSIELNPKNEGGKKILEKIRG